MLRCPLVDHHTQYITKHPEIKVNLAFKYASQMQGETFLNRSELHLRTHSTPSFCGANGHKLFQEGCSAHGHKLLVGQLCLRILSRLRWMRVANLISHHSQLLSHQAQSCQQLPAEGGKSHLSRAYKNAAA